MMQASVIGSFTELLTSANQDERAASQKLTTLMFRMKHLELSDPLQERVLHYFETLQHQVGCCGAAAEATAFIDETSPPLGLDVRISLYGTMIRNLPFVKELDTLVAEHMISHLQTTLYVRGDLVVRRGQPADWMGLIAKGLLGVLSPPIDPHRVIYTAEQNRPVGPPGIPRVGKDANQKHAHQRHSHSEHIVRSSRRGVLPQPKGGDSKRATLNRHDSSMSSWALRHHDVREVDATAAAAGGEEILHVLHIGDYIGETALFAPNSPRQVDIQALTWINLQVLDFASWQGIAEVFPSEMVRVRASLSTHVRNFFRGPPDRTHPPQSPSE